MSCQGSNGKNDNELYVSICADECRCNLPRDSKLPKGNFNWCCNTPTPKLGINRHIDLSQQAFSAVSCYPTTLRLIC